MGNLDKAIELFTEAANLDPDYAETYNNLGFAYFMKGDRERAKYYFNKVLEIDPNHEKARINLNHVIRAQ